MTKHFIRKSGLQCGNAVSDLYIVFKYSSMLSYFKGEYVLLKQYNTF